MVYGVQNVKKRKLFWAWSPMNSCFLCKYVYSSRKAGGGGSVRGLAGRHLPSLAYMLRNATIYVKGDRQRERERERPTQLSTHISSNEFLLQGCYCSLIKRNGGALKGLNSMAYGKISQLNFCMFCALFCSLRMFSGPTVFTRLNAILGENNTSVSVHCLRKAVCRTTMEMNVAKCRPTSVCR